MLGMKNKNTPAHKFQHHGRIHETTTQTSLEGTQTVGVGDPCCIFPVACPALCISPPDQNNLGPKQESDPLHNPTRP